MARKRHKPEEIIGKLREVEVLIAQGRSVADAVKTNGVTEQCYYRWRRECGGLKLDQARRLEQLERENARLRKAVADLTLDKVILAEAARGTTEPRPSPSVHQARHGGA
jgi:putative transposase